MKDINVHIQTDLQDLRNFNGLRQHLPDMLSPSMGFVMITVLPYSTPIDLNFQSKCRLAYLCQTKSYSRAQI